VGLELKVSERNDRRRGHELERPLHNKRTTTGADGPAGHDGAVHIESPFGEYADDAVIRLTVQDILELNSVLDRMLAEGPSAGFRAFVPPVATDQIEVAWDLAASR